MPLKILASYVTEKNGDIYKFNRKLYDPRNPLSDLLPTRNILNTQYEKAYKAKNTKKMKEIKIKLNKIQKLINPYVKIISKKQFKKERKSLYIKHKLRGGLINQIPDNKLGLARNKQSIPTQAKNLVKYLKFDDSEFIFTNNTAIYGSFNYRLQNYPSDIDSSNTILFDVGDEVAVKIIETNIKKLVFKLVNNKLGRKFADLKCGNYTNGESIHWTPSEIKNGFRNENKPDINGESTDKKIYLYDAILDFGAIMKLDMVTPYMGRYVEVSCMYQITSKNGQITHSNSINRPQIFLENLAYDTGVQFKKQKIFKVIKRMYSNAKMRRDTKMLKILEPLINSNLSRLASMQADFSTLELLLNSGSFPTINVLNQELQKIKFNINNVLDINLNQQLIFSQIDLLYLLLKSKKKEESHDLLKILISYFQEIINTETITYLKSIKINNINQFGKKYIIL